MKCGKQDQIMIKFKCKLNVPEYSYKNDFSEDGNCSGLNIEPLTFVQETVHDCISQIC